MIDYRPRPFLFFIFYLVLMLSFSLHASAQDQSDRLALKFNAAAIHEINAPSDVVLNERIQLWALRKVAEKPNRNHRINAILLAIALGPFGVHRLYLGTHPRVPVIYTLTLGGGLGVLPIIDIIAIATTKDLDRFIQNDKVIMWAH